jgi:hypothetical protein
MGGILMEYKIVRKKLGDYVLRNNVEKIFERNGFYVNSIEHIDDPRLSERYILEINGDNPYGEDWYEEIIFDGYLQGLKDSMWILYTNFDINEDVKLWINSAGKNGVPDVEGLVKNAQYKDNKLRKLYDDLNSLL